MLSDRSADRGPIPRILILGMGNPILSDDGVGLVLASRLRGRIEGADTVCNPMIDLSLLDDIMGYDVVYLIDAMSTRNGSPGELKRIGEHDAAGTLHLFSSHGMNFFELMELGRSLGCAMPEVGCIYGIEIGECVEFGESLSPVLEARLGTIEETICADIKK